MRTIIAAILIIAALQQAPSALAARCSADTYWSKSLSQCLHRPYNWVAICWDGTTSAAAYVPGACRGHGGVDHIQKRAR